MGFSFLKEKYIQKLFRLFEKYDEDLYVVGGAIRNFLANKDIEDIDFATTMLPEKMIQMFAENKLRHDTPGIKFGTVRSFYGGQKYEITTLRQEKYEKNTKIKGKKNNKKYLSRFPEVKYVTDPTIDAKRRDFTANAIYVNGTGDIIDPFNGVEDIKKGIIKFIGNPLDSVDKDPFRILRYFRFCADGFYKNFDEVSLAVCIANFDKTFTLNKRKFISEYNKIMSCRGRFIIINKWAEYGLLNQIDEFVKTANEKIQVEDEEERKRLKKQI